MVLDLIFDRFVADSPLSVMARATIEHALSAEALDALFERTADKQYTRELLFSTVVDLMSLVVCGTHPHIKAAFQAQVERIPVTLKSVYEKLQQIETHTAAELVRFVAGRCEPLIRELNGARQEWLPGYRIKIIDGNHLAGTQRRLKETRGQSAAPLPGLSLVVLDPQLMLAVDVLPCEDGHAQERTLLGPVLERLEEHDLAIADRNFCTTDFLTGLAIGQASFVIRRHAKLPLEARGGWGVEVETPTGWVTERPVEVADAAQIAALYLRRWTVEGMFQELTQNLGCEVNTLCYPKAALFAFCVALMAYNVLAVTKAALRAVHGEERVEKEVSGYYLALELAGVYLGMMIAIPAEYWVCFQSLSVAEMAGILRELAAKMQLVRYKKHPRPPKKAPPKRVSDKKLPHVSTARLLKERKKGRTESH